MGLAMGVHAASRGRVVDPPRDDAELLSSIINVHSLWPDAMTRNCQLVGMTWRSEARKGA